MEGGRNGKRMGRRGKEREMKVMENTEREGKGNGQARREMIRTEMEGKDKGRKEWKWKAKEGQEIT